MKRIEKNDEKLDEEERLKQELAEGYKARRKEGTQINEEWEVATLESWLREDYQTAKVPTTPT